MPILDIDLIMAEGEAAPELLARELADAAGAVFDSPKGSTWVKLRALPKIQYAENGLDTPEGWQSVFIRVLKARRPVGGALADEMKALAEAVARVCGRPVENVHILYEPDAAGRIGFGGTLVNG